MLGILSISDDGEFSMIVMPDPNNPSQLLVQMNVGGMVLPQMPIWLPDLRKMLQAMVDGNQETK